VGFARHARGVLFRGAELSPSKATCLEEPLDACLGRCCCCCCCCGGAGSSCSGLWRCCCCSGAGHREEEALPLPSTGEAQAPGSCGGSVNISRSSGGGGGARALRGGGTASCGGPSGAAELVSEGTGELVVRAARGASCRALRRAAWSRGLEDTGLKGLGLVAGGGASLTSLIVQTSSLFCFPGPAGQVDAPPAKLLDLELLELDSARRGR